MSSSLQKVRIDPFGNNWKYWPSTPCHMATLTQSGSLVIDRQATASRHWMWAAVMTLIWILLFLRLTVDWTVNPQYSYGWMVPLLALALAWRRRSDLPEPAPPARFTFPAVACGALFLLWLPIRLIEEANPEWRLVLWAHAWSAVFLTLLAVYRFGGWPWLRHFAFPIGFTILAVPWPTALEQSVIQNLMGFVAMIAVELLDALNIPAVRHGNIIEIGAGLVGVDEACSGVRSLQTTLLVCLFLGEFFRFTWLKRSLLLLGGILLAISANIGRTLFLVWTVSTDGFQAMNDRHDAAGISVLLVVLGGIWLLARCLRIKSPHVGHSSCGPSQASIGIVPRSALVVVAVWLLAVEAAVEWWFRSREAALIAAPRWSVAWPESQSSFRDVPIGETALGMLRCDSARGAGWRDVRGYEWRLNFLRWEPGRNSAQLAKSHSPDICLRGIGLQLVSDLGTTPIRVADFELPVRRYVFSQQGQTLHVFYCVWDDRVPTRPQSLLEDGSVTSRLAAVAAGKRNLGQQVLQIAIHGPADAVEAITLLQAKIQELIRKTDGSNS